MSYVTLTDKRWVRLSTFTAFYFAQGIPIGLLSVAIPAWLAMQDVSLGEIASYQAIVSLPWAFKLIAGPFMDRFQFPPMGFRRPWVMAAQGGLTLAMVALAVVDDPLESMSLLIALGFVVNVFSATQDVAVDGMAIDILPENERGRANAFMGFGQAAGFSSYGALCGTLLPTVGMPATALVCAVSVGVVFVVATLVRERPGERTLPWTAGTSTPRAFRQDRTVLEIFRDLLRVLFLPMSLLLTFVEFINRMRDGIAMSLFPTFAVQELGFTTAQYTQFNGAIGLIAATTGALVGPLVDRFGAKRFLLASLIGSALVHTVAALTPSLWPNLGFILPLALISQTFTQFIFVAIIALYMNVCWAQVAATQFAIYMSLANLSRSIGAALFALVADQLSYQMDFAVMAACLLIAAVVLTFFDQHAHERRLAALHAHPGSAAPDDEPVAPAGTAAAESTAGQRGGGA